MTAAGAAAGLPAAPGRLPWTLKLGYGVGSVGTGVFSTVPGLLLLYYMTEALGVPADLAGLGIFIPKMWDVVTDPVMGMVSDRTRHRWGRRRPWLLAGALTLPPSFALIFAVPGALSGTAAFVWVTACYALAATAFTLFSVPYVSMPAEMTDDSRETTSLVSWRIALVTVGILVSGAVAPMLVKAGGGGREGYRLMGAVVGTVILLGTLGAFLGTRSARHTPPTAAPGGLADLGREVAAAVRNRPFTILLAAFFVQLVAVGCLLATVPFYARYALGGGEQTVTLLFVSLVLPAVLAMPPWVTVAARIGNSAAFFASILLFAVGCLALFALGPGAPPPAVYGAVVVMGVAYAGSQLFPFAMLPDTQRLEEATTGDRREGVLTGLWMAADKGGLAFGALLAGLVLEASGFVEGGQGAQSDAAVGGILAAMGWVPAALLVASLGVLARYRGATRS